MIEGHYCERFHKIPIKDADFIMIDEEDHTMSYIGVPIVELFDNFFEEYADEKGEVLESITEDMLIEYMTRGLLEQGYKNFHIYKKVL